MAKKRRPPEQSPDPVESVDVLADGESFLPEYEGEDADESAGGLELDEQQSREIREIFIITLPQYLQPVEEMVEEVLSGAEIGETARALTGTLSSLAEAASRMGYGEIFELLDSLRAKVAGHSNDALMPDSVKEAIRADLHRLITFARQGAPFEATSPTVFAALKNAPDVDDLALSRLTAAGVVTVEQLQSARPDELAAVSGLAPEVIAQILDSLAIRGEQDQQIREIRTPQRGQQADASGTVDLSVLRTLALERLQAQVDAEQDVAELEDEIGQLRAAIERETVEASEAEQACEESRQRITAQKALLLERGERLGNLRAAHQALLQRDADAEQAYRGEQGQLLVLRKQERILARREADIRQRVETLVDLLGRLHRLALGRQDLDRQAAHESGADS